MVSMKIGYHLLVVCTALPISTMDEYDRMRGQLAKANAERSFDSFIKLSPSEEIVDRYVASMRDAYVSRSKADGSFAPSRYFHSWNLTEIRSDSLFVFLDAMPKGANLHLHSGSSGSVDFILTEGLATEGCHLYLQDDNAEYLKGTLGYWHNGNAPNGFETCSAVLSRKLSLREQLRTWWTSGQRLAGVDSTRAWNVLDRIFARTGRGLSHRPFLLRYLANTFDVHFRSGVMHIEIRVLCGSGGLGGLSDLDGNLYNGSAIIATYLEALREFQESSRSRANFSLNVIVASLRSRSPEQIKLDLELAVSLRVQYPEFVVGWDAVAQEDPFHRSFDYVQSVLHARALAQKSGVDLPLFLHDGESDDRNNSNVVDAVLLECPRIGHGFNTGMFFPEIREQMKKQGTVLEVNPISNQVLQYVPNLETHPAAALALDGVRIVIASDDPGAFGYEAMTLDWWAATTAWRLTLKSLKALAFNSLQYSSLTPPQKHSALLQWQHAWEDFVRAHATQLIVV